MAEVSQTIWKPQDLAFAHTSALISGGYIKPNESLHLPGGFNDPFSDIVHLDQPAHPSPKEPYTLRKIIAEKTCETNQAPIPTWAERIAEYNKQLLAKTQTLATLSGAALTNAGFEPLPSQRENVTPIDRKRFVVPGRVTALIITDVLTQRVAHFDIDDLEIGSCTGKPEISSTSFLSFRAVDRRRPKVQAGFNMPEAHPFTTFNYWLGRNEVAIELEEQAI